MVLRRLENQGSYDILMNGFPLQSTTTPKKANKVFEPFEYSLEISIYRSPRGTFEADKTCVGSQIGIWDREAWWSRVEKHGGVTPINLGKSRPPP
ncbi:unnamed protein product [Prunus armeniaca]